ncbi:DEAD/DEAH box helicase [Candidatus Woesearchaeota archaeon]|nr:DEAD/DEAH box helicase [Candidatus Woesearchaeota archaeon]
MYKIKNFEPRNYQLEILNTTKNNNTLVVLPTGTGKTKIAILTAIERLNKNHSNVLIMTPTKPLSAQIQREFKSSTTIPPEQIILLTGALNPKKRQELWESCIIAVATPQTIQKDLENNRISLSSTSLLVVDECHRSRLNFANTKVANFYQQQSKSPCVLALTASPGGTKQKIDEIKENLSINAVEIRTEEDIEEFIQKKEIVWLEVNLPEELKKINHLIKTVYQDKTKDLKKIGFNKPTSIISKKDLIILQQKLRKDLSKKNPTAFYGLSLTALLIKIDYASELLETQGIKPLAEFLKKLETEETKAAKNILNTKEIQDAILLTNELLKRDVKHPKLYMLKGLIKKEIENNQKAKIIVFANYRTTIDEIVDFLNKEKSIKATKLIGQKSGLTQQEQINVIKRFEDDIYNTLVCSSIGEEGIDIKGATLAIMYDQGQSSEIRKIQRAGRVARLEAGKIISLLTKDTREIAYYWSSQRKEKTMKKVLSKMQESQTTLI